MANGGAARRRPGDTGLRARLAAGALGLFVVVTAGIVALFSLYYANLHYQRSTETLRAMEQAARAAVDAQVAFKLQVQEWKNSLLRGRDPADLQTYSSAMEERAEEVRGALTALAGSGLDETLPARIGEILAAHEAMTARYREALADFEAGGGADPWSVDARVRGIDRPIDQALDALAEGFSDRAAEELAAGLAASAERYDDLRRVVLVAHGLGALLLLGLLLASLRAARR